MAFMMPVVKKDYNIYKSNRDRCVSDCTNDKSSCAARRALRNGSRSADGGTSLSTSPNSDIVVGSPAHRSLGGSSRQTAFHHGSHQHRLGAASRFSSQGSQSSLLQSPAKSSSSSLSSPKMSPSPSMNMFHSKLVDKLMRSMTSKPKDNNSSTTSSKGIAGKKS